MPIEFAFDEDEDPVVELRRYREALSRRFKTTKALSRYFATALSAEDFLAQTDLEKKKGTKAIKAKKAVPEGRSHRKTAVAR